MYTLAFATRFTRAFRKYNRSGRFPLDKFQKALAYLEAGKALPAPYTDHSLKGPLVDYREFHLEYDILVQYRKNEEQKIITLSKIGTHTELFGA